MDLSAAARSLRVSEGTMKSRLFRGREILRSKLQAAFAVREFKEAST